MKTLFRVSAVVVLLVTSSWAANNLNLSKSNINRLSRATLVTASASLSGTAAQIVYHTPANADFVLTQICVGSANGGVLLQIGGVSIVQVGSGLCQTFSPGLLLTPDQPLTCASFDAEASSFCTINGLQGLVNPPTPAPLP